MPQLIFVDANVFVSRTTRDWLLMLRQHTDDGLFTLTTSPDSLAEAVARLRDLKPAAGSSLTNNLIDKVRAYVDDVIKDYPGGPVPHIKDQGDWHIHHTAVAAPS